MFHYFQFTFDMSFDTAECTYRVQFSNIFLQTQKNEEKKSGLDTCHDIS